MSTPLHLTATGANLLESRFRETFGLSHHDYEKETRSHPVPRAYLNTALRIVDTSGAIEQIEAWTRADRKGNAGRPAIIPARAVLALFLLNMQAGRGVTYPELADTIHHRLTIEHFATLGISDTEGDRHDWYNRIWRAANRLVHTIDPYPAPRNRILKADEFRALLAAQATADGTHRRERNQQRLDVLCNLLVVASLRLLPRDIWSRYQGNAAIDATRGRIRGPKNTTGDGDRSNPDAFSTRYARYGNHEGTGAGTDEAAYELETAVMVWNQPGENQQFPSLITAISCHNPGKLSGHAAELVRRHIDLGFTAPYVIVDRAYNGENPDNFHIPIRRMGARPVFDYKALDLGLQSYYEDLILVDGNWHVNWMPEGLITATASNATFLGEAEAAEKTIWRYLNKPNHDNITESDYQAAIEVRDELAGPLAKLDKLIANREPYRMIPKGRPDADGWQRFSYPDIKKMPQAPEHAPATTSISVPPLLPKSDANRSKGGKNAPQPIKHLQPLRYRSLKWRRYFGMRSLVEASNNLLKNGREDMANPRKRSGRGYAFNYLAMAIAVVSSNIERITTFFTAEASRVEDGGPRHRARRRKDPSGQPLSRTPGRSALSAQR